MQSETSGGNSGKGRARGAPAAALVVGLLAACGSSGEAAAQGQPVTANHPRLLLTTAKVADLKAKMGDPDIAAILTAADRIAKKGTIDPGYQGDGWSSDGPLVGLAYLVTGNMMYATPLLDMMDKLNTAAAAGDISALTVDSTFG